MAHWIAGLVTLTRDNRVELRRFGKFAVVGIIGSVVHFSVLNLGFQVLMLPKWLANPIAFTCAVISNFTWNRLWTFPESRGQGLWLQLGQFFVVNLAGLGINQAIFLTLDRYVFAPWGALGTNVSLACAIGVVLFWNFVINRIWTYRGIR